MITLFCVRPKRFNIGNDAIFLGLRHLLHTTFDSVINTVQVPAIVSAEHGALSGMTPHTIHEMNLYGDGVIVGGGNLYENGQLDLNVDALDALQVPLMLFSLSYGRIYDNRHQLVRRTDAMPAVAVRALNNKAALSLVRDQPTLDYLRSLGIDKAQLGACPSLLLSHVPLPQPRPASNDAGTLLSIRHPSLMSIPLRDQARLHGTILDIANALEADGFGPVRLLCHDTRDLAFAASLATIDYILPDDVYAYLELLRSARLVVSFRLHAFLPCLSFGTPAVNISYDERSTALVRAIGLEEWDVDFIRTEDVAAAVRDRCSRLEHLDVLRKAAQPLWQSYEAVMREAVREFAQLALAHAEERGPARRNSPRMKATSPV